MRDLRNDFIQEIKLKISSVDSDVYDLVVSSVASVLDKYAISERVTEIVPYDMGNVNLIKSYVGSLIVDGKSKSTINAYVREIKKFVNFIRNKDIKTTCTFDIRNYLAQEKIRGISNRTLENSRANLSAFFQWLTVEDYIPKNPCYAVNPVKYTDEVKQPFSSVELDILRSNCKTEKERAIVETLVSSGVRVSELVSLDIEDIDFQKKSLHVRHGKGDKERYTYIDSVACDHIIKYLADTGLESGTLFQSQRKRRYTTHGIRQMLIIIAERSGIKNVHPHRFRRTFATRLAARGMKIQEIQKLMGHTNLDTTMHYIVMDDTQVKNSYQKYTA